MTTEPSDECVERVARAICNAGNLASLIPWDNLPDATKEHAYMLACAALAALVTARDAKHGIVQRMATELAPQLDDLISCIVHPHDGLRKSKTAELHQWLWNNKVSILRCLQAIAATPSPGGAERE